MFLKHYMYGDSLEGASSQMDSRRIEIAETVAAYNEELNKLRHRAPSEERDALLMRIYSLRDLWQEKLNKYDLSKK